MFSKNLIDLHKSWRNFSGLFLKCDKRFDKPILTHYAPVELQYWDLANFMIFRIFRISYQKMLRKKFWCCRCKSTEENRPNLKILIFFLQTKIYRVTQENETTIKKKMQSNLSEESLRKDNGHFLEITQGPFQRKALPLSVLY